jgi:hypothetical protein
MKTLPGLTINHSKVRVAKNVLIQKALFTFLVFSRIIDWSEIFFKCQKMK